MRRDACSQDHGNRGDGSELTTSLQMSLQGVDNELMPCCIQVKNSVKRLKSAEQEPYKIKLYYSDFFLISVLE